MARIRSIKPEAFTSETLTQLSIEARWTFAGLWTYADDQGRGKADARLIKAAIWPLDDKITPRHVEGYLNEMEQHGLICRYQSDGRNLLHVTTFGEHQHPSKPQPSKFPPCPKDEHGTFPEESGNERGPFPVGIGVVGDKEEEREEEEEASAVEPRRPDVDWLCTHLADRVEGHGAKRPAITNQWRTSARLLIDKDERDPQQAHRLIDWAHDNEFWAANVLAMPKFRIQYDQLLLQARREQTRNSSQPSNMEQHAAFYREFQAAEQNGYHHGEIA